MADMIITLDGTQTKLAKADFNRDGKTGGVELIRPEQGITPISTPTELGESLKELNFDKIEPNTRMSGIDMRARLHWIEVPSILALDALVGFGICPEKCLMFTRQKKRLSVSIAGQGRKEIVDTVSGKREQDQKKFSVGDWGRSFVGLQSGEQKE